MDVHVQVEGRWFEWSEEKANRNIQLAVHDTRRIPFDVATTAFFDDLRVETFNRAIDGERRYLLLGVAPEFGVLVVIFTERKFNGKESTRIIPARKADSKERRIYQLG